MEISGVIVKYSLSATMGYSLSVTLPVDLKSVTCDSTAYTSDTTLLTSDKT